jgi:hypothetical protein
MQIDLTEGWNILGSLSAPVEYSEIIDQAGIIASGTLYGFGGGYISSTTIEPGKAYWINALSNGTITLQYEQNVDVEYYGININESSSQEWNGTRHFRR